VPDDEREDQHGLLLTAAEVLVDSTRSLTQLVARAGAAGAQAVVPDPAAAQVNRMLASLRRVLEQAPQLTDEIDVLLDELHAKRLSLQAMAAELTALDQQLEVLERALTPVQKWNTRWQEVQHTLLRLQLPVEAPH
jgi:hypothetical protein